jgi:hypothetical protein
VLTLRGGTPLTCFDAVSVGRLQTRKLEGGGEDYWWSGEWWEATWRREGGRRTWTGSAGLFREGCEAKKCGIFWSPLWTPHTYSSSYDCPFSSLLAMYEPTQKVSIMLYYLAQHERELLYPALWTSSVPKLNKISSPRAQSTLRFCICWQLLCIMIHACKGRIRETWRKSKYVPVHTVKTWGCLWRHNSTLS